MRRQHLTMSQQCTESLGRNEIGTLFQDREEAHVPMEDRVKKRKIEDEIREVGRGQTGKEFILSVMVGCKVLARG